MRRITAHKFSIRPSFVLQLALLLLLLIEIGGCPHRPEGPEIGRLPLITSEDPQAEAELREAREFLDRGAVKEATRRYESFLTRRPRDPLVPVAQLWLGRIRLSENQIAESRSLFAKVAANDDPSIAEQGRFYGAIAAHLQGNHREAVDTLTPMKGRTVDPEDTALLLRTLAAASAEAGEYAGALDALDALTREAVSEKDREEARSMIVEIAKTKATDEQIARAYGELSRDGEAWPRVARRSLRIADENGDVERMREIIEALKEQEVKFDKELQALALRAARPTAANPRVVGAILSLSGRARKVGELALRGLMLAADLPPKGPLSPDATKVVFRDDGADPEKAVQAVNELVSTHRVVAIIGPIESRSAAAAAARAQELGVPLIALTPTGDITEAGPMVFRLFPTPEEETRMLVAHARGRGAARFAVLHPKGGYGTTMSEVFARQVELQGGTMTVVLGYEPNATSFGRVIASLKKADFDALFVADTAQKVALVAPATAAADLWSVPAGKKAPSGSRAFMMLLPSVAFDAQLPRRVGRYLQGAVFSSPFDSSTATGTAREFADQYQARFGAPPDVFAAFSHDAFRLIQTTVDAGATSRDQVAERLLSARAEQIAGPSPGFTAERSPVRGTRLLELRGKEFVPVEAAEKADAGADSEQ
jgi:ABC-type branched-subunit amino acid transport system substrate-binding protein/TolA-binding protein